MQGMELRHLRYFIVVAEELNITRAATRLHVSQPPLSRQIRDLENELGVKLIERTVKPIRLTKAGVVFFAKARSILNQVAAASKAAQLAAKTDRREIHVGYSPSLTVDLLPKILRTFQKQSPKVAIKLHDLSSREMISWLETGKLDVALMIRFATQLQKNLKLEKLRDYSLCVAVSSIHHPLSGAQKIGIRQLLQERLIGYTRRDYPEYHTMLGRVFAPYGPRPPIAEEHDGVSGLTTSVELGHGVALVPQCLARLSKKGLRIIPISPAQPKLAAVIAYRTGKLTALQNDFIAATKLGM
jgi:DNA-binding transcriptional LysR family regulator